jgi:hypothetical protein
VKRLRFLGTEPTPPSPSLGPIFEAPCPKRLGTGLSLYQTLDNGSTKVLGETCQVVDSFGFI